MCNTYYYYAKLFMQSKEMIISKWKFLYRIVLEIYLIAH